MNHNENPFAYSAENNQTEGGRGFQDYENPFAFQPEPTAPAAAGKGNRDTTYVTYTSSPLRLQRWNAGLRLASFIFCLLALLLMLLSGESKNTDGFGVKIKYTYSGSFKFFFYTNVTVALYALAISVVAFVMFRTRTGETSPDFLLWPFIVLNGISLCFLILAFASALSIESLNHGGMTLDSTDGDLTITWPPLCSTYKRFCGMIDSALGLSMAGFITLLASTGIDAYILHRKNV